MERTIYWKKGNLISFPKMSLLFNITSFILYNLTKTWHNLGAAGTDYFWVDFVPWDCQFPLQGLQIRVRNAASFGLQNGPQPKVHGVQIWRGGRPNLFLPKAFEISSAPSLNWVGRMGRGTVLLKGYSLFTDYLPKLAAFLTRIWSLWSGNWQSHGTKSTQK